MSKQKICTIVVIVLWAMTFICPFALESISDVFISVGLFSGVSALIGMIILLNLISRKDNNWIAIGLYMTFFGIAFSNLSRTPFDFLSVAAVVYAIAGLVVTGKGIADWRAQKRKDTPKEKRRVDKKVWIGIALIFGGIDVAVLLFYIDPMLMLVGHVAVITGIVVLGKGLAKKTNETTAGWKPRQMPVNDTSTYKPPVQKEYCGCCRKVLPSDQKAVFEINGLKCCADCKRKHEQANKNQHEVCSVCGVDLPAENMHLIDDALFCHACFLEKCSQINPYETKSQKPLLEKAVGSLRKQIMDSIAENPAYHYQLASLLWGDAAKCFPKNGFQWEGAWFKLDLRTGGLFAEVATYPNQFGANYQDVIALTPEEFNRISNQFNMPSELQTFATKQDWQKLFNDEFTAAVSNACGILQKQEEKRRNAEIQENAVKIPGNYNEKSPNMHIVSLCIEINQRYSSRIVKVTAENGKYKLSYTRYSYMSSDVGNYDRVLSDTEAVWLEKQVESTVNNPDQSTWQSLPGGDSMDIKIKRIHGSDVSFANTKPIRKYSDLQNELERLAQYGSARNN